MLDRLWDLFAESCQSLFIPLVCAYYAIGGSLFLNTAGSDAIGLERAGDFFLAPIQYLLGGQTASKTEEGEWIYSQRFDYQSAFWIKTGACIMVSPIALPLGVALKGLACLSSECRDRMALRKSAYLNPQIKSNLEQYKQWGIVFKDPKWHSSQGHVRRLGDEQHLSAEKKALEEVGRLLTEAGIPWWVDCGTCLGAYRYGGVIPWDEDIDIAVLLPDFDNVRRTLLKLDPQKYLVQDWSGRLNPQNYFKIFVRETATLIDIYHFAIEPDSQTIRYILSLETNCLFPEWVKIRERRFIAPVSYSVVFPLKKMLFDGIEVFVPNDPKKYLQRYYGENLDPAKVYDPRTNHYEKALDHPYWQRAYVH
ncbi:MAG: LicD family protein [Chlamydiae bacterium]|nr:LicD family protein [Chlamydiota bacterium]